ncbi:MAG: hypothetical protein EHM61_26345 [Acidobacteria bacterium]|nr:MAG: hypothetical protein EHM61_26345 [Acidobacteriota bacterium]
MNPTWCCLSLICAFQFFSSTLTAAGPPPARNTEIRALWVDGFHAGIRSKQEADQLIADAVRNNFNTLFIQVRRRGDSLYLKSLEPLLEDAECEPGFDPLGYTVEAAHQAGLEVHAWINAMALWRNAPPPHDLNHVFNRHGLNASGDENWLTYLSSGSPQFPVGYFLDPGHPGVTDHLVRVYLNVVSNYAVDGIHFDYIRYPETEERHPKGSPVGYNPTSLARFARLCGRQQKPDPGDPLWMNWRREQITQLVRRIYIEAKAIRPQVKVSASTIAWGQPPASSKRFLETTAAGRLVYQDWHGWMKEGILDLAVPMNYARETDPNVKRWFDGWIAFEKRHKYGRHLAVGIGAYLNSDDNVLDQLERVRRIEGKNVADGVSFFSYASPSAAPRSGPAAPPATAPPLPTPRQLTYLAGGTSKHRPAFSDRVSPPAMQWIDRPAHGWVAGTASAADSKEADGLSIEMRKSGWWPFRKTYRTRTDGNGWFGFATLKPGAYEVWILRSGERSRERQKAQVVAGKVSRVEFRYR